MASTGGLTRRRGGGASTEDDEDGSLGRITSQASKGGPSHDRTPETSYTGGENGHKIAFDPRDISENEERSRLPKLTLMEEVLLMGLKDKQVLIPASIIDR
jgi:golgi phosphoprotein 3